MLVYYLIFIIPFIVFFILSKDKDNAGKTSITFFFILWFILLALRHDSVGGDLVNYKLMFERIPDASFKGLFRMNGAYEPGFMLYMKLFTFITTDFQLFLAFTGFLSLLPMYKFYRDRIENPMLTIAILLLVDIFAASFSGLRQSLAMALAFPLFNYARDKKIKPFILVLLLAYTIHHSSFIMALIYPLSRFRIDKRWLVFIIPVMAFLMVFKERLFLGVLSVMEQRYMDLYGEISDTGAFMMILLFFMLMLYSFFLPGDDEELDEETITMRNLLVIVAILQIFSSISTIAMRMNRYFLLFTPLLIPKIAAAGYKRSASITDITVIAMIVVFYSYFLFRAYHGADMLQIFPYSFFWQN